MDQKLPNRWLVLLLLLGIAIFNQADRFLLAALVDPIKRDFSVSDGVMGLLMGPAFAVFYSTLAIPIAIYADRASRIKIIVAGCVIWSIFTILCGYATGPWSLALARMGVGVGEAAFQAPAYSLIAAYFATQQRGRAFAVLATATYFGQMLGYGLGPQIAAAAHWRTAFEAFGVGGLIIIIAAWAIIREPHREALNEARPPFLPLAQKLFALASYRGMAVGMAIGVLSGVAFGLWAATLFARNYSMTIEAAGAAFGSAFVIPGLLGAALFGFVADWAARGDYGRILKLSAIALTLATASVIGTTWAPSLAIALAWAIPAGLIGGGWAVGIYAGLQFILPDKLRATGTAIAMLLVNLLGYVCGPWLVGILSNGFGEGKTGLRLALSIVVPVGFVGAVMLWRSAQHLTKDKEKLSAPGA